MTVSLMSVFDGVICCAETGEEMSAIAAMRAVLADRKFCIEP
jgi:hypothetical protein